MDEKVRQAWYLRCSEDDVSDRAVLVGDRGRVHTAAQMLSDATIVNEDRGLTTATGTWKGTPITVSAFGMGAPIAAVVLHELRSLGVTTMLRLGTAMALGESTMGDLVLAEGAIRGESTSATYVPDGYPAVADFGLASTILRAAPSTRKIVTGLYASYDGFYSEMFPDDVFEPKSPLNLDELVAEGVVALDMETSAILAVGRMLGARCGALCLASVDARTHAKLEGTERAEAERDLLAAGFDALALFEPNSNNNETRS